MPRPRKPIRSSETSGSGRKAAKSPAPRSSPLAPLEVLARVGRPPTRGVTATAHFDVRVTPEERDLWREAAGEQSVSEWLRALANRAAKRKADG